jgi:hypothetical protein
MWSRVRELIARLRQRDETLYLIRLEEEPAVDYTEGTFLMDGFRRYVIVKRDGANVWIRRA